MRILWRTTRSTFPRTGAVTNRTGYSWKRLPSVATKSEWSRVSRISATPTTRSFCGSSPRAVWKPILRTRRRCVLALHGVDVRTLTRNPQIRAFFSRQIAEFDPDVIITSTDDPGQLLFDLAIRAPRARVVYLVRATIAVPFGPDSSMVERVEDRKSASCRWDRRCQSLRSQLREASLAGSMRSMSQSHCSNGFPSIPISAASTTPTSRW